MGENLEVLLGKGETHVSLHAGLANRHGMIAGATGTGKTVSLQVMAEGLSRLGVPVFMTDVKGDLSGISQPGSEHPKITERLERIGLGEFAPAADDAPANRRPLTDFAFEGSPTVLWDLDGEHGHPIRTTVTDLGPALLARLLDLNDTQEGVLQIVFRHADENQLLLLDFEDLRAMLEWAYDNARELSGEYGNVSKQSVGAIQRQLLSFESQGADHYFGEPALEIDDFLTVDDQGRGMVNVLAAEQLMRSPKLYATFLLWLLAELFESLPEVGDPEKPKLVFFFDEAHLLFDDAPKALQQTIERVVRLIRSKGVGVFFVTQNPIDIPEDVAGQLGNRVQHALRAFTPRDKRAIKAAAETFRINPDLDVEEAITQLRVGEALVSTLDEEGAPTIVQRTLIKPPRSRLGPLTAKERAIIQSVSLFDGKYEERVDRESAAEVLAQKTADAQDTAQEVARKGEEAVRERPRKSPGIWGKAGKAAARAAAGSLTSIAVGAAMGRRSRANPLRTGATAFVRNIIGGLMR